MKNILILFGLFIAITSCTYNSEEELIGSLDCNTAEIDFSNHIFPIIEQNCAVPTCHISGSQKPDLTSYSSIIGSSERIKIRINNGTMPPSYSDKSLSAEEKLKINCWIEGGMPQ